MPRRKQYKISARQTAIYDVIVAELQQNPELADYVEKTVKLTTHFQFKLTTSFGAK